MIVALWVVIGLIISAACVSALGAAFSVVGLGTLFSGAMVAVWAMAGSLEFAKFVLAAYLHQRWKYLNIVFKSYLVLSVTILSLITSMGIFGFLSDAYQSSAHEIEEINIKLNNLRSQQKLNQAEIARINKGIDEIPESRVTKKMKARAEAEPRILSLIKASEDIDRNIGRVNLQLHEIKKKIGPLVYIARAMNKDVDTIVTYLILVFVVVFDPLAICLVIATSEAMETRRRKINLSAETKTEPWQDSQTIAEPSEPFLKSEPLRPPAATTKAVSQKTLRSTGDDAHQASGTESTPQGVVAPLRPDFVAADDEIIEMKYIDDKKSS